MFAQECLAWLHQFRQEAQAAHDWAVGGAALATQQGFALYVAWGTITQGWALTQQALWIAGMTMMREGIEAAAATGSGWFRPYFLALFAEASGAAGQPEEGLKALAEALNLAQQNGECMWEAELYRLKGELLLQEESKRQGEGSKKSKELGVRSKERNSETLEPNSQILDPHSEAEACFRKAIEIARQQSAKSLELRAVMSLSRLWQQQGKPKEAQEMLAAIYGWFTEGFATKDLQDAKALLVELAGGTLAKHSIDAIQ